MVALSEIAANDYNLNIPRYIDSSEAEDLHDLSAHLKGGIPTRDIDDLNNYWQVFPSLRNVLFSPERTGYNSALIAAEKVKQTILDHSEFKTFATQSLVPFTAWSEQAQLKEFKQDDIPKALIHQWSEDLLKGYDNTDLISKYDIYQILMDYWAGTMQDDVYLLVQDGWQTGNSVRVLIPQKDKKGKAVYKEVHDFEYAKVRYVADIIPPELITARYYKQELGEVDELTTKHDAAIQTLEATIEEQAGEEGLLAEAKNDKEAITKTSITARVKQLKLHTSPDKEELKALYHCLILIDAEAAAKKAVKQAQDDLNLKVFKHYPTLTVAEIQTLVVQDKWLATLQASIKAEIERVTQQLTNRIKELEQRYAAPLPQLANEVDKVSEQVAQHLKAMGLEW